MEDVAASNALLLLKKLSTSGSNSDDGGDLPASCLVTASDIDCCRKLADSESSGRGIWLLLSEYGISLISVKRYGLPPHQSARELCVHHTQWKYCALVQGTDKAP